MDNKPIVIDGVDVSECEAYKPYLGKYDCIALGNKSLAICKDSPNCYFKQLTRKTQECEEWKNIINEAKNAGIDLKSFFISEAIQKEYDDKIKQLKLENEELRKTLKEEIKACQKWYQKHTEEHFCKLEAEQKLERIRQACKDYCKFMCLCEAKETCENCNNNEILQILDEVENV